MSRRSLRQSLLLCACLLLRVAVGAGAQTVTTPPIEGALAITVNGLAVDVNARPACVSRGLPCTHDEANTWGGFGVDASVARRLAPRLSIVGAFSASAHNWNSGVSGQPQPVDRVRGYLAGLRIDSGFHRLGWRRREMNRLFGQAMMGGERSTLFGSRPVVEIAGGVDTHDVVRTRTGAWREATLRMWVGYRLAPADHATGFRFGVGVVFGPRFGTH
jgi:hypothetical protein